MILAVLRHWPIDGAQYCTTAGRIVVELTADDHFGITEQRKSKRTGEWFGDCRYAWIFWSRDFRIGYAHHEYDGCHHALWLGFGGLTWSNWPSGWCQKSIFWGSAFLVGDPRKEVERERV